MIAVNLGVIDYEEALSCQYTLHEKVADSQTDDVILLLEHPPVITIGRSGSEGDLHLSVNELAARKIPVKHLGRGGKITCHYPGQMVCYPIMDLRRYDLDIPGFVYGLEEVIITTLADFGVMGERIENLRGVFVKGNKIAAIGVEVRRGVSMHGISLNVFEERSMYGYFVPCGIPDRGVEFLECSAPRGVEVVMDSVKRVFLSHMARVFDQPGAEMLSRQEYEERCPLDEHEFRKTVSVRARR